MKIDSRILSLRENVQQLSDKILLEQTQFIAEHERGVTILALRHLREVEIRRLFVDLGYSSMYAYCIKHLKYSENKTSSRLASARLMTELPEIEEQIETGNLNITTLSKVQTFMRSEKTVQHELNKDQKLALIAECENKPTRQIAKDLIQRSHQPALLAEKFRMTSVVLDDNSLSLEYTKFEALLNQEGQVMLQDFKNLYAHDLPDQANVSVLKFLLKKALQHKKKKLGIAEESTTGANDKIASNTRRTELFIPAVETAAEAATKANIPRSKKYLQQRKVLPAAVKRFIWQRANACCEHVDPKIKTRCRSQFALQPDHIIPVALGGSDEIHNLQLLCRIHNSRRAIKTFGVIRK